MSYNAKVMLTTYSGTTDYTFSFDYLDQEHVHVYLDGVEISTYTFLNAHTIKLDSDPLEGQTLVIQRITPNDTAEVNYTNGSVLLDRDLDLSNMQMLFLSQESQDRAQDTITIDNANAWDADGKIISNVGDPAESGDAVSKGYLDATYVPAMQILLSDTQAARDTALAHRDDANQARIDSQNYANSSEDHMLDSQQYRDESEGFRNKARDWAVEVEDVEVEPGQFSSFHWAQKAHSVVNNHDHDGRYYTETEVDSQLSGKADIGHNHDGTYEPVDPNILRKDQNAVLEASFSTQPVTVDDSASLPTPDLSLGNVFKWTWGANRIFRDVTVPGAGAWYVYIYPAGHELSGINYNYDVVYNGFDASADYCIATIVSDGTKKSLWIEAFTDGA